MMLCLARRSCQATRCISRFTLQSFECSKTSLSIGKDQFSHSKCITTRKYCSDTNVIVNDTLGSSGVISSREHKLNYTKVIPTFNDNKQHGDYMLPSGQMEVQKQNLLTNFLTANNVNEVLRLYAENKRFIDNDHLCVIMKQLAGRVKHNEEALNSLLIMPEFEQCCRNALKNSKTMDVAQVVVIFRSLCIFKILMGSEIMQNFLQMIRYSLNELELYQVVGLYFCLNDSMKEHTNLSDAIKKSLPLVAANLIMHKRIDQNTLLKSSPSVVDLIALTNDPNTLHQLISILSRIDMKNYESHLISKLFSALCTYRVIFCADQYNHCHRDLTKLISKCLKLMIKQVNNQDELVPEYMQINVLDKLKNNDIMVLLPICDIGGSYNDFFDCVTSNIIKKSANFDQLSIILPRLKSVKYIPEYLTDYIMDLVMKDREELQSNDNIRVASLLLTLTKCPIPQDRLHSVLQLLLQHSSFNSYMTYKSNGIYKIVVNLLYAKYTPHEILDRILEEEFLRKMYESQKSRTFRRFINYCRIIWSLLPEYRHKFDAVPEILESAREDVQMPFLPKRNSAIGNHLHQLQFPIISDVVTPSYIYIDHLIVLDENNQPIEIQLKNVLPEYDVDLDFTSKVVKIDMLDIPEHYKKIALIQVNRDNIIYPAEQPTTEITTILQLLRDEGYDAHYINCIHFHKCDRRTKKTFLQDFIKTNLSIDLTNIQ